MSLRLEALFGLSFGLGALGRRLEGTPLRGLRVVSEASRSLVRATLDPALRRLMVRLPDRLVRTSGRDVVALPVAQVESPWGRDRSRFPQPGLRVVRDESTVNWMIACPWIAEDAGSPSRYAFSDHREVFRFLPYELRRGATAEPLGYLVLSISSQGGRRTLKILDHALREEGLRPGAFRHVLWIARHWRADILEASDEWWSVVAASPVLRSVAARPERAYLVHARNAAGPLASRLGELVVGYCDGEAPFT